MYTYMSKMYMSILTVDEDGSRSKLQDVVGFDQFGSLRVKNLQGPFLKHRLSLQGCFEVV